MSRVYFTDRDLGKQFPAILSAAGLHVERHTDLFPPAGPDEQWLEYCGTNNRIAITHDRRIRHKPNELDAVIQHGVSLVVVIGKAPFPDLANNFVNTLTKIEAFLDKTTPPFIAKVYRATLTDLAKHANAPGNVLLWYPS